MCVTGLGSILIFRVNISPYRHEGSVAEIALAGLVQEGVSGVCPVARALLLGAVLPLDAVAAQVAPLGAGFAPLDPGHLGDFGQGAGLGGQSTGHPGGHGAPGGRGGCWRSNTTVEEDGG